MTYSKSIISGVLVFTVGCSLAFGQRPDHQRMHRPDSAAQDKMATAYETAAQMRQVLDEQQRDMLAEMGPRQMRRHVMSRSGNKIR